jgi:S-adenosylmethionine decarboxylase
LHTTPRSIHCILELNGCPSDLLNDHAFVCEAVKQASEQGLSTLLDMSSHQFHPQGVTVVGLLAESHISIHTWPECGYAAVDVFTCGETADPHRACRYLVERFRAASHQLLIIPRGQGQQLPRPVSTQSMFAEEVALCPVRS